MDNRNVELGRMVPLLPPSPRGLEARASKRNMKCSFIKSNDKSREEVRAKYLRLLKNTDLLQALSEKENPVQVEEDRAIHFLNRLLHVQAASRRLQGQLDIHSDETWPLPPLPSDRNPFILEMNAIKIRTALEDCKDFAVTTNRESSKFEHLDVVAKSREERLNGRTSKTRLVSFKEEEKARDREMANANAPIVDEDLQGELRQPEDKSISNTESQTRQASTAAGSERAAMSAATRGGSSLDIAGRGRREKRGDLTGYTHSIAMSSCGRPEYNGRATSELANRPQANSEISDSVYDANSSANLHCGSGRNSIPLKTPTASNNDQDMRRPARKTKTASIVSDIVPPATVPLNQGLQALSVHDSGVEGTQSSVSKVMDVLKAPDKDNGRKTNSDTGEMTSFDIEERYKDEGLSSSLGGILSHGFRNQDEGVGKQTICHFVGNDGLTNAKERHRNMIGLVRQELDVAASLRNHSVTFVDSAHPGPKERNPAVPQPEKMANTLTEAICSYLPLEAKPILTLTLERIDPPLPSPTDQRCILLKHFEVGLDGVEGLCQGIAKIPESPAMTAERERRVGRLGTFKQEDGGFYRSLKCVQQKEQLYGKGYWYFFGVKFKQTGKERKLKKGGKWFLFGAPIEAVHHLDIKRSQENTTIMLGGGLNKSGTTISPFRANFKRTHTLFSRGGLAPMDIWPGGEDWDGRVFEEIRTAMANNGLRVGFLYADSEAFAPRPMGFPATSKNQSEKKRKQFEPNMTLEEMKAMEDSMRPKRLSAEDIGTILTTSISNDRAKRDAASRRI